jgi:Peptidase family M23
LIVSTWLLIRAPLCGLVVLAALGLAAAAPMSAASSEPVPNSQDALTAEVLFPPSPFEATDKLRHVVYEIVVQNVTSLDLRLERFQAIDARRERVIASYGAAAITEIMISATAGPTNTLVPGEFGVLFVDITFPRHATIPARLVHRFVVSPSGDEARSKRLTVVGAETDVLRRPPLHVDPPLEGGNLLDLNGCCSKSGHARFINEVDGRLVVPQRYAIDFVRLEGESTFAGDPSKNESYFIFGDNVIAAAAGRVVAARDGMPENTPPNVPPEDVDTATGNYVLVEISSNRFALYAHLHTGSVRVGVGERVQRGQVLGLVGNTGNSTEAHLHFHVTDGPSPLGANGVPYDFRRFQLEGRVIGLETGTPTIVPADPPRTRNRELPLNGDILAFPPA